MPAPTADEMLRKLYEKEVERESDPTRRPATSDELRREMRVAHDKIDKTHSGLAATIEAHSQTDERNFSALGGRFVAIERVVNDTAKRVDALERKPSPFPGGYSSVRSVMPPPGKPTDTGSWNVKQDYLEEIQKQIGALHAAREEAEREAAIANARAEGAEEARRAQAKAAAEAKAAAQEKEAAEEAVANRRVRNLKLVLAVVGAFGVLGPCLAWCASEARHAAADVAAPAHR
jgi:hypothetical protein